MFSLQASEDQIKESRKATSAKSKAKPKAVPVPPSSTNKSGEKHGRSPQKPDQVSPNPGAAKRIRGKQENPDQSQQLEDLREACVEFFFYLSLSLSLALYLSLSFHGLSFWNLLIVSDMFLTCIDRSNILVCFYCLFTLITFILPSRQANRLMMEELAKLKKASGDEGVKKKKKDAFKTPPPKVKAPSPKAKSRVSPESPARPMSSRGPDATQSEPSTEAARLARLRRVCEIKPSGRCHVPKDIHERWLKGTNQERLAMADELEASGWAKDRSSMKYYLVDCIFILPFYLSQH